jgi:hypothetical protein
MRDEHGNYRLDLPHMTPLPRDEAREERGQRRRIRFLRVSFKTNIYERLRTD